VNVPTRQLARLRGSSPSLRGEAAIIGAVAALGAVQGVAEAIAANAGPSKAAKYAPILNNIGAELTAFGPVLTGLSGVPVVGSELDDIGKDLESYGGQATDAGKVVVQVPSGIEVGIDIGLPAAMMLGGAVLEHFNAPLRWTRVPIFTGAGLFSRNLVVLVHNLRNI
jgi:hypothetical protein